MNHENPKNAMLTKTQAWQMLHQSNRPNHNATVRFTGSNQYRAANQKRVTATAFRKNIVELFGGKHYDAGRGFCDLCEVTHMPGRGVGNIASDVYTTPERVSATAHNLLTDHINRSSASS